MSKSPPSGRLVQFKAKTGPGVSAQASDCPQCAVLRVQCGELRDQRDDALKALADEREISNALRLGYSRPYHYVGSYVRYRRGEQPLRYDIADAANQFFKTYLGLLHSATRGTAGRLFQLFKRLGRNIEP